MQRVAPESFSKVFESLRVHGASHVNQIQTPTTDTRRTPRAQFETFNRLLLKLASTKADLAPAQKIRGRVVDWRLIASCIRRDRFIPTAITRFKSIKKTIILTINIDRNDELSFFHQNLKIPRKIYRCKAKNVRLKIQLIKNLRGKFKNL